jgi:ATP-binding cassette subfamily B protein
MQACRMPDPGLPTRRGLLGLPWANNHAQMKKKFPHIQQLDAMDCGPTSLKMVAKYYGKDIDIVLLREACHIDREGVSIRGIADGAERIGFRTMAVQVPIGVLKEEMPLPCIAYWNQRHFVVLHEIRNGKYHVADPATGNVVYTEEEFCKNWIAGGQADGIALGLEPSPDFYEEGPAAFQSKYLSLAFLLRYLKPYKQLVAQILLSIFVESFILLSVPLLTQAMVDTGINQQNLNFIYLLLAAQLMLFVGRSGLEIVRSWILLHIATRMNLSILSDYLIKLMKLPMSYFDAKYLGDLLQRMKDHDRIKRFLTASSLRLLFSVFNMIVFGGLLVYYSTEIAAIFAAGSVLYIAWILFFMRRRRDLDNKRFSQMSDNQSSEVQLMQGMQEIKLNNCEQKKRWQWESIQVRIFNVEMKSLALEQYQNAGGSFINELKNILITFWAATQVMDGAMTLGMMMASLQMIGMLNAPLAQFLDFSQEAQDAKMSLERLAEVHDRENESDEAAPGALALSDHGDLVLENVSFRYGNPSLDYVLHDITAVIPKGKTTAIVGTSGSGKTTLMKLLLKFYPPESGTIKLGKTPLADVDTHAWRGKAGVVMQDGFLFSESIAHNIALADDVVDKERLLHACEVANIRSFIEELPLNYNTKIGGDGIGLSRGQQQRILIARAIYKQPEYLFFDEATSALDTLNEASITAQLNQFAAGKTVVVIAHRLSTVKHADQIMVLHKGRIAEVGSHHALVKAQGMYYRLVKNQLELG